MMNMSYVKKLAVATMLVLSLGLFAGCTAASPAATDTAAAQTAAAATQAPAATDETAATAAATDVPVATDVSTVTDATSATDVPAATNAAAAADAQKVFTAEELAKYDGQNGNPAYVAVDGTVYDVSSIPQWSNGSHAGGMLKAGMDQSEAIKQSPHGKSVLQKLPVVGLYQ